MSLKKKISTSFHSLLILSGVLMDSVADSDDVDVLKCLQDILLSG